MWKTMRGFVLTDLLFSVCLQVQHGLVNEVHQLEATIMALKQKLSEAQWVFFFHHDD